MKKCVVEYSSTNFLKEKFNLCLTIRRPFKTYDEAVAFVEAMKAADKEENKTREIRIIK